MRKIVILALSALMVVAMAAPAFAKPDKGPSIVDIVVADDGEFDILEQAVISAGLAGALDGNRQFTVFAPTDAAFVAALGADEATLIGILAGANGDTVIAAGLTLSEILTYHVIPGERFSDSVLDANTYPTLNGKKLSQGELFAAGLGAAGLNISASNGVIHTLGGVLLP